MPKHTHPRHICITATVPGFRRAGIAHPAEPTTYAMDDFSKEQLEQLQSEPRLMVEFVDAPEADTQEGSTAGKKRPMEPDSVELALKSMTVAQLKEIAAAGEIVGFASMKKDELVAAIELKRDGMGQ